MFQFILDNKEWLFSGIGVPIFIAIFVVIKNFLWKKKKPIPIKRNSEIVTNLNPSGEKGITSDEIIVPINQISSITCQKIGELIKNAPPLQRDEVKKNFVGIKVLWDAYLCLASKDDEGIVSLWLSTGNELKDNIYSIHCTVAIEKYPELGILPEGSRIKIQGEIAEADIYDIKLINVILCFIED
jgi:hypothetical protein